MQDLTLFNKDSAKAITQDIQVFNCELGSIRVIVDNGEPLFCLSDLCDVLEIQNKTRVKEYIDKEFDYDLPTRHPILDTLGREQLRNNGYLMKDNMPYQKYIDSGYFDVIEQTYKTPYGSKVSLKTLVTGKGQIYFTEKLRNKI